MKKVLKKHGHFSAFSMLTEGQKALRSKIFHAYWRSFLKKALKKHDHFSALSMLTEGLIKAESITFSYIRTEGFFEKSIEKVLKFW